jgi:D-sedoheptulose 7-phosphate isomerase
LPEPGSLGDDSGQEELVADENALQSLIARAVQDNIAVKNNLLPLYPGIAQAAMLLVDAFERGGQAIFFGNGGSAADAQHLAAELVGSYLLDREPLPALALSANTSAFTAVANDLGYDQVFSRQLRAHARPGDVAVAISTSGRSANVVKAVALKAELDLRVISLTGEHTGTLEPYSDVLLGVPSRSVPRIQETHILIGHILCEWVERALFGQGGRG